MTTTERTEDTAIATRNDRKPPQPASDVSAMTEAALRPVVHAGRLYWAIAGALAAVVLAGVGAYVYQLAEGLEVTGLNNDVFWGIYTANLVAFIGISYGGAVISAVLRLAGAGWRAPITRLAEAMALVSLAVGALFAVIHVGRPDRLWEFAVSPNPQSPLVWDIAAISTYLLATALFLYLPLIPDLAIARAHLGARLGRVREWVYRVLSLGWDGRPKQRRLLGWGTIVMSVLIIPLAVSVHSVLAWAFGVTMRPGWHSTVFAPYFVVAALLSGVAAVILVIAAFRRAYHLEAYITDRHFRYLSYLMLALGLSYLYLTISELLTEGYMLDDESGALFHSLLLGNFALLFWLFLVVGGALPTILVVLPWTRHVRGITVAAALAVGGMWLKRLLIVIPPLSQPIIESEVVPYQVSIVEMLITLAATASIPLLLMLFVRVFPVLSIHEMAEEMAREDAAGTAGAMDAREARATDGLATGSIATGSVTGRKGG